jgi:methionyl aminopeptidase
MDINCISIKFNLDILTKLGTHHKKIMEQVKNNINNMKSNKELYNFINNYLNEHSINKAFPIGISINEIIAHDSYHKDNKIKFNDGDLIKVDIGLEEDGNIIDSARTYIYTPLCSKNVIMDRVSSEGDTEAVGACREIVQNVEIFIRNEYTNNKKINIQKISTEIYNNITTKGYHALDFLGGHTIEHGKVHGKKLILNKPLTHLPVQCKTLINPNDELVDGEMFAIEVFIPNKKTNGYMIQNEKILITHYELSDIVPLVPLDSKESSTLKDIGIITKRLPYEYRIHDNYDKYIIKALINKGYIKKHLPLEWIDKDKKKIKYIHYEDCYLIDPVKGIINLSCHIAPKCL